MCFEWVRWLRAEGRSLNWGTGQSRGCWLLIGWGDIVGGVGLWSSLLLLTLVLDDDTCCLLNCCRWHTLVSWLLLLLLHCTELYLQCRPIEERNEGKFLSVKQMPPAALFLDETDGCGGWWCVTVCASQRSPSPNNFYAITAAADWV